MIPYFRISQVQMVTRLCCFISPTLVMISYFIIIHDIFAVEVWKCVQFYIIESKVCR